MIVLIRHNDTLLLHHFRYKCSHNPRCLCKIVWPRRGLCYPVLILVCWKLCMLFNLPIGQKCSSNASWEGNAPEHFTDIQFLQQRYSNVQGKWGRQASVGTKAPRYQVQWHWHYDQARPGHSPPCSPGETEHQQGNGCVPTLLSLRKRQHVAQLAGKWPALLWKTKS